jgi:xanthine/uracil permease
MKKIINWLAGLLRDEKGTPSSKRFIGVIAGLSLCITLFANQFTEEHIAPSPVLINAVAALAFGALGLASVDKIWGKKEDQNKSEEQ